MPKKSNTAKEELEAVNEALETVVVEEFIAPEDIVAEEAPALYTPAPENIVPAKEVDELFLHLPFAERIRKQKAIESVFPEFYAERLGKIFPFSINHQTFIVKFDGGKTVLPKEVHDYFTNVKLPKILNSSIQVSATDSM